MAIAADPSAARGPVVGVVGWRQETNESIVAAWRALGIPAALLGPEEALETLVSGDVAVGRFDVLRTLDGVEAGLEVLDELAGRGVRVLNGVESLLNTHDKLRTARLLDRAGLPNPRTVHCRNVGQGLELAPPLVVKPRFGSWGADVFRCETEADVLQILREVGTRPWFLAHGALLQELVPPAGSDLRLVVAGGDVVGAAERIAAHGEWRTNVSLGGTKRSVDPSPEARDLGRRAAAAIGADLVGIDLLPVDDGYLVLELNGAVEFDPVYDLSGSGAGVFEAAAGALGLLPVPTGV
jgi:[lysine-biosynthesis-protein LysW]--L-2-aminoadipate ligase